MTETPDWQSIVPTDDPRIMRLSAEAIDHILQQETLLEHAPDLRAELDRVRFSSELVSARMADVSNVMRELQEHLYVTRLTYRDQWMQPLVRRVQDTSVGPRTERRAAMAAVNAANDLESQGKAAWVPLERRMLSDHTFTTYKNPFLLCKKCFQRVTVWHNPDACPCEDNAWWNEPCGHVSTIHSECTTFGEGDKFICQCIELGGVPHEGDGSPDEERHTMTVQVTEGVIPF